MLGLCQISGHDPRPLRPLWEEANRGSPAPAESQSPLPRAPRNDLPADISGFMGRQPELELLLNLVDGARAVALDGMAGVGKTSLAVHAAHLLAEKFPDGQLYIDMHGFTPGREPMQPGDALRVLLTALDVAAGRIPEATEERAALWRAELSRRRAIVVLDNVANADQARLLLPGAGDSFAIITSRSRLLELDPVHPISLNVFSEADARVLFETAVGDERVARAPTATTEVLRLCGHLPLAIRVAAARLRHRPSWTVSTLAERLSADLSQLDTAFLMSLHQLDPAQRRMFLLLGLMPGIDFDAYAAAALADVPLANARSILEDLVDAHLVQQPTADRHRLHDLLRQHARRAAVESNVDSLAALDRLLDYYLYCASTASITASYLLGPAPDSAPPWAVPALDELGAALAWLDIEYENLRAAFRYAADTGLDRYVVGLPQALQPFFSRRGRTAEWNQMMDGSLAGAQRLADPRLLAEIHVDHMFARHWGGRTREADAGIAALPTLLAGLDDPALHGRVYFRLGLVYRSWPVPSSA
ncbi:MAG TPA: hypothetical protein DGG94_04015 [Micromonosporaceae bacterium]|nr:hypothetical protein [Micromonosporaceae bacterium]